MSERPHGADRQPVVAGRYYPEDEGALRDRVRALLGEEPVDEPAVVAVAPHGSLDYSGSVSGAVYARCRVAPIVVVLCPNHTSVGPRGAIMTRGSWRVPGASIPVDSTLAEELRAVALLTEDRRPHDREHAIEVHLPFLRHRNPRVRLVPVCLSEMPFPSCVRIGTALADVIIKHGRDVLVVASTALSHYVPADDVRRRDEGAIERMRALDAESLYAHVRRGDGDMCGVIPTAIALVAARALGVTECELVRYGHSGDASGDLRRVVGYAGLIGRPAVNAAP